MYIYGEIVLILFCLVIYLFFLYMCSHMYGALLANFQPDDHNRHAGVYFIKSK